jgi:predicted AAA+ superfamily ATPase
MIKRLTHINKLLSYKDKAVIKVLTGVRRCGKSTILHQYAEVLKENSVPRENIIEVNFEDIKYEELKDYHKLNDYVLSKTSDDTQNYYLMLDEIQEVEYYERVINSLNLKPNLDIYVTGSNAYFLSGELATYLSGRYVEIPVYPFSFTELQGSNEDDYNTYISEGGFPYVRTGNLDDNQKIEYLEGIYSTVVLKDVVKRKKIGDVTTLENVARFLADNIGNLVSMKKIADTLTTYGTKTNPNTVESYVSGLTDALLFYKVGRYDIKGKEHLKNRSKYYLVDLGLRNYVLNRKISDYGFMLENVVFLELLRRGWEVKVGKIRDAEVDFVISDHQGHIEYIQVALTVRDQQTLARELAPLQSIRDSYPKKLITLDNDPRRSIDGIEQIYAIDWLRESGLSDD